MSRSKSDMIESLRSKLKPGEKVRILAYGSSNTERFLPGMHWFDILELSLRDTYGRFHHCINTGLCGDTSRGLLARFSADAALFRPHLVIITIGGNDSNPAQEISPEQFDANLSALYSQFTAMGCQVIFQTYYAPDPARQGDLTPFRHYMEIVRIVAKRTGSGLVDHLVRWEAFQQARPAQYLQLMHDGFHVNQRGNAVLGLDLARQLGAKPALDDHGIWDEALTIQGVMDKLCK